MSVPVLRGGAATAIGSWPGTDGLEAARTVLGELEELPHLVELPDRGVGADMIGRTAAMLVDLPIDTSTTGYRLTDRPGAVLRRAQAHLARDLDFAEEALERAGVRGTGTPMKLQVAGPVTIAAELELRSGRRALTDPGAVRDLAASLAEGVRGHVHGVRRRFGVDPVVQVDEPSLPAALAGALPGLTRFDSVPALPGPEAQALLGALVDAVDGAPVVVHGGGAAGAPVGLLRRLDVAAVSFFFGDGGAAGLAAGELDALGEWLDAGRVLVLGLVPSLRPAAGTPDRRVLAQPAVELVDRLGFSRRVLAEQVIVSPDRGLAAADPEWARIAVGLACTVAAEFAGDPEAL